MTKQNAKFGNIAQLSNPATPLFSRTIERNRQRDATSTRRSNNGRSSGHPQSARAAASKQIFPPITKVRVIIVEDTHVFRQSLETRLRRHADLEVVGSFDDAEKIFENGQKCKPDVVLLCRQVRTITTLDVVKSLYRKWPAVKVVIMCLLPSEDCLVEFTTLNVYGFILRGATVNDFLSTIRLVARGFFILPQSLAQALFSHIAEPALEAARPKLTGAGIFTTREQEIARLIAGGRCNKEIAEFLGLSIFTIKSHVHNILQKLGLHNRLQIACYAMNEFHRD
jgi:DNA-binding NarL/FixJ family response regulator